MNLKVTNRRYVTLIAAFATCSVLALSADAQTPTGETAKATSVEPAIVKAAYSSEPATTAVRPVSSVSLTRVGVTSAAPIPLTLNDAIRKALEGNNSIEIARDDVRFQETQIRSMLGFYDPVFTATPRYTRNSTTGSASTNDFTVNANVLQFIKPGGGNYQAYFNNTPYRKCVCSGSGKFRFCCQRFKCDLFLKPWCNLHTAAVSQFWCR